jgi:hypothetical protein
MELEIFPHDPKNPGFGYAVRFRSSSGDYSEWSVTEEEAVGIIANALEHAKQAEKVNYVAPRTH